MYRGRETRIFWLAAELGLRLAHVPVIQASKLADLWAVLQHDELDHVAAPQDPLTALNSHLGQTGHKVGDRFTVADINMAEVLRYARYRPGLIEAYPAIRNWITGCQAQPAFKVMWAARKAEAE